MTSQNKKFFKGEFYRLLIAAAILCGASAAPGYPKKGWRDVHCRDCTMTDCTQAFEVWCQRAPKGVGFERCSFTGNRTLRVGGGWGALVRPKREVATPLLIYRMDTDTVDITVTGNTFENMPRGLVFNRGGVAKIPPGYHIYGNTVK